MRKEELLLQIASATGSITLQLLASEIDHFELVFPDHKFWKIYAGYYLVSHRVAQRLPEG